MKAGGKRWFKLDNAAKLYPAVATGRWSSIFRLSAELTETVEPRRLQEAAEHTMRRFPSFQVRLKKGFFWYYLEEIKTPIAVREDTGHPCLRFSRREENGFLLRVLYYKKRISVEFFHVLTDGTGGLIFLKTLLGEYLRLSGRTVRYEQGVLDVSASPDPEETRDVFNHMPLPRVRLSRKESRAYHFEGHKELPHTLNLISASMPCDRLLTEAHAHGATLTEYLTAVLLYAAYQDQNKRVRALRRQKPLRVSVPVNMRRFYPSPTVRNFSSFINPGIDPRLGAYTFEEIVRNVHAFMQYNLNPKFLFAAIATNVADEKKLPVRLSPLFLKNWVISSVYHRAGDRLVTTTLTNPGVFTLPPCMARYVTHAEMLLNTSEAPQCVCALLSYGNEARLTFTDNILEKTLPREALRFLVAQGIPVSVDSNQNEEE